MTMRSLAGAVAVETPACADKIDLVDAAFTRSRGPAAHQLAAQVCPMCPDAVARECFLQGMTGTDGDPVSYRRGSGEHGVWGGTLEIERRRARRRAGAA